MQRYFLGIPKNMSVFIHFAMPRRAKCSKVRGAKSFAPAATAELFESRII